MYIIIAGCGTIGANLAISLSRDNHDVVVIDSDPDSFKALGVGFNGMTITGMCIDEDVLREAGIEKADALAAVTSEDNMNVMVSQVAKTLFHVPKVITRLYDPTRESVFHHLGLTTFCPTKLAVGTIREMLLPDECAIPLHSIGFDQNLRLVKPPRESIGRNAGDYKRNMLLGLARQGKLLPAFKDTCIEENDFLLVAQNAEEEV
jgi:trk system potassium uptake protein TrkA